MANRCMGAMRSSERWSSRSGRPGPLHQAAYRGNLDRVRNLVEAGADVTARDERFGAPALEWARWREHEPVVAYFRSVMEGDHPG